MDDLYFIRGVDLLIHECYFADAIDARGSGHSSTSGTIAVSNGGVVSATSLEAGQRDGTGGGAGMVDLPMLTKIGPKCVQFHGVSTFSIRSRFKSTLD